MGRVMSESLSCLYNIKFRPGQSFSVCFPNAEYAMFPSCPDAPETPDLKADNGAGQSKRVYSDRMILIMVVDKSPAIAVNSFPRGGF